MYIRSFLSKYVNKKVGAPLPLSKSLIHDLDDYRKSLQSHSPVFLPILWREFRRTTQMFANKEKKEVCQRNQNALSPSRKVSIALSFF